MVVVVDDIYLGDVGVGDGEIFIFKWGIDFAIDFIELAEIITLSGGLFEKPVCTS